MPFASLRAAGRAVPALALGLVLTSAPRAAGAEGAGSAPLPAPPAGTGAGGGEGDAAASSSAGSPAVRNFELNPPGGPLAARYRPAPAGTGASGGRAPAILVIGANAHPLDQIDPLASELQARGYSVLAIDYPSHMRLATPEGGLPTLNPYAMKNSSLPGAMRDASAGLAFLARDPAADASSVLLAGIGLGANLAAMIGAHDSRVRAIALLDPGNSCDPTIARGALDAFRGRPALLVSHRTDAAFRKIFLAGNDSLRESLDADEPDSTGRVAPYDEIPRLDRVVAWIVAHHPAAAP